MYLVGCGVILDENNKMILAMEIKRDSIPDSFKQALLYLKIGHRINNDGKIVYALCSNGQSYSIISFDGSIFKSICQFQVLLPAMKYSNLKEQWKRERYSLIVDIIYTILH